MQQPIGYELRCRFRHGWIRASLESSYPAIYRSVAQIGAYFMRGLAAQVTTELNWDSYLKRSFP